MDEQFSRNCKVGLSACLASALVFACYRPVHRIVLHSGAVVPRPFRDCFGFPLPWLSIQSHRPIRPKYERAHVLCTSHLCVCAVGCNVGVWAIMTYGILGCYLGVVRRRFSLMDGFVWITLVALICGLIHATNALLCMARIL